MNIFFNSRIYANQSLLNVLFGQQQKATISRSNGCIGTRDTLTISASGKEKLTKSTSGRTHNTVTVKNPDHVCKGVKSVTVDGKAVEGNVLPVAENGATVNVEVVMG